MGRFFEALWWLCALVAAASFITDLIWLDGKVPAWIALTWVFIASLSRLSIYVARR